jgi:hypothetical protein
MSDRDFATKPTWMHLRRPDTSDRRKRIAGGRVVEEIPPDLCKHREDRAGIR